MLDTIRFFLLCVRRFVADDEAACQALDTLAELSSGSTSAAPGPELPELQHCGILDDKHQLAIDLDEYLPCLDKVKALSRKLSHAINAVRRVEELEYALRDCNTSRPSVFNRAAAVTAARRVQRQHGRAGDPGCPVTTLLCSTSVLLDAQTCHASTLACMDLPEAVVTEACFAASQNPTTTNEKTANKSSGAPPAWTVLPVVTGELVSFLCCHLRMSCSDLSAQDAEQLAQATALVQPLVTGHAAEVLGVQPPTGLSPMGTVEWLEQQVQARYGIVFAVAHASAQRTRTWRLPQDLSDGTALAVAAALPGPLYTQYQLPGPSTSSSDSASTDGQVAIVVGTGDGAGNRTAPRGQGQVPYTPSRLKAHAGKHGEAPLPFCAPGQVRLLPVHAPLPSTAAEVPGSPVTSAPYVRTNVDGHADTGTDPALLQHAEHGSTRGKGLLARLCPLLADGDDEAN